MPRPSNRPASARSKTRATSYRTDSLLARLGTEQLAKFSKGGKGSRGKKGKKPNARAALTNVRDNMSDQEAEVVGEALEGADSEELESRFQETFDQLNTLVGVEAADFRSDDLAVNVQRAMLAMVLSLIPAAEANYQKSRKESAAYALVALSNQARDLISDLKLSANMEERASFISGKIIGPAILGIGRNLMDEFSLVKNAINTHVSDSNEAKAVKRQLDELLRGIAKFIQESQTMMDLRIASYLTDGVEAFDIPPPSQKRQRRKRKD